MSIGKSLLQNLRFFIVDLQKHSITIYYYHYDILFNNLCWSRPLTQHWTDGTSFNLLIRLRSILEGTNVLSQLSADHCIVPSLDCFLHANWRKYSMSVWLKEKMWKKNSKVNFVCSFPFMNLKRKQNNNNNKPQSKATCFQLVSFLRQKQQTA